MNETATITRKQANAAADKWSAAYMEQKRIEMEVNQKIQELKAIYEKPLQKQADAIAKNSELLLLYANQERDQLFSGGRTTQVGLVKISKRTSSKLQVREGFDDAQVLAKVKELLPDYVRITQAIDKTQLKNNAEDLGATLRDCGLEVVEQETTTLKVA